MNESIDIYSQDGTRVESRVVFADKRACAAADFEENDCDTLLSCLPSVEKIYAIVDRNAYDKSHFVAKTIDLLTRRGAAVRFIDATEEDKTMDNVLGICYWLMDCGADRQSFVLTVGGGITTDIAGFAASIYMRGVRFAFVPTTILSQVDAAIGGKTGVNFDKYKNMLGLIRQPEFTYITSAALESLSYRDFLSGAAEMLKAFVIEDGGYYKQTVAFLKTLHYTAMHSSVSHSCHNNVLQCLFLCNDGHQICIRELKPSAPAERISFDKSLQELIAAAVRVKVGIVSRDRFEKGERRKLNLGHTFAHAIETLARRKGDDITHGEAVAVGVVMAARLSEKQNMAPNGLAEHLCKDFEECGLPFKCPYPLHELAEAMSKDKKSDSGKIHFALMHDIGNVTITELTASEACGLLKNEF